MDQAIEVPSKVQPGEFIVATRCQERGPRVVVGEVKQVKVGTDGVEAVRVKPVMTARNISDFECKYHAEALFDACLEEVDAECVLSDGCAAQLGLARARLALQEKRHLQGHGDLDDPLQLGVQHVAGLLLQRGLQVGG